MLIQLAFASRGSDHAQLDRFTEGVKVMMAGWDRALLMDIVEQELERRIRPMVFREAMERVGQHHARGMRVYAVSATMEEIIAPLADLLGLDGAIPSVMEVEDGCFTGEILRANHGDEKARRLREFAEAEGIDLARSVAYSDSITDAEFLRSVGRAYAVNPDKALRRLAEQEGWGVLRFSERVRAPMHRRRGARIGALALGVGIAFARRRGRARA